VADPEDRAPRAGPSRIPGWIALPAAAGLIALVALTSRSQGAAPTTGPIALGTGLTVIEVLGYVVLAIGVAGLPIAIAVSRARARQLRAGDTTGKKQLPPTPWWVNVLGLAVFIPLVVFQFAIIANFLIELLQRAAAARSGTPSLFDEALARLSPIARDSPALFIALVIVLLIVFVIVALAVRLRLTDDREGGIDRGRASTVAAVEVSLDAIRREPDPRRAVIAAYAAMERSLARAGYGRHDSEAPLEYLRRVLAASTRAVDEVRTLTLLFQHAKFSHHAVDESMRSGAIDALERIRSAAGGRA
jgi:Domain of unknown function (DUF4129)